MAQSRFGSALLGTKAHAFNLALGGATRGTRKGNCGCFELKKCGKPVNWPEERAATHISVFKILSHFGVGTLFRKAFPKRSSAAAQAHWTGQSRAGQHVKTAECRVCSRTEDNFPWRLGGSVNWIGCMHSLGLLKLCDVRELHFATLGSGGSKEKLYF